MTNCSREPPPTVTRCYFDGGTDSPNLGWRAPGAPEAAALTLAGGRFVFDGGEAVVAGPSGSGAGSPWHPVTTNTETTTTTSAMTWRKKDETRMRTSLDRRVIARQRLTTVTARCAEVYANGIPITRERKTTIFVGTEPERS